MSIATEAGISGPTQVVVGVATTYSLVPEDDQATWSLVGPGTVTPQQAETVQLTAGGVGPVVLTAKPTAGEPVSLTVQAVAQPPAGDSAIPTLGLGYGTVVVSLAVASVTAALGLAGVISGEAVATVLGSLVTYSVAKATGSGAGTGS